MPAEKIRVEAKTGAGSGAQEMDVRFRFHNEDSVSINPENYRVVVHAGFVAESGLAALTTETGFDRTGISPDQGGLRFEAPATLLAYETELNPPCIAPLGSFNLTYRLRFEKQDALPDINPGGSVGDIRIRLRRTDNKVFPKENGNQGPDYYYENSYLYMNLSGTYQKVAQVVVEYNDTDPANPDSLNWSVVTEYQDGTTPDPDTGLHPYGGTGSFHQDTYNATDSIDINTYSAHRWIEVFGDSYISSDTPDTPRPNASKLWVTGVNWWNGSAVDNRRGLIDFDAVGQIPPGQTTLDGVVWLEATDDIDHTGGKKLDFEDLDIPFDESTATWNTHSGQGSGVVAGSWTTFSNPFDQKHNVCLIEVNAATVPLLQGNGGMLKFSQEVNTNEFKYYSKEQSAGSDFRTPHLVVRIIPGGPQPGNTVKRLPVF